MENTEQKTEKKGTISYYNAIFLREMLMKPGYNNKALIGNDFIDVHWLKYHLKEKIEKIASAVELLAKEMKHEIIPFGNGQFQYCLAKEVEIKDADGKVIETKTAHEKASKEFVEKKKLIEDTELEGFKFKFMSVDSFRAWVDNLDCQFELAEYILNI